MPIKIRGIEFQGNLDNAMGLKFYNLSHRFGLPVARTGRISKTSRSSASTTWRSRACCRSASRPRCTPPRISTRRRMSCRARPSSTRCRCRISSAPASSCRCPKKKWESITDDDLEKACGQAIRPHDVLIVNTGWHKVYEDSELFLPLPRLRALRRRLDGREAGQGRRPRHPGQRPSARDRHRPAAQRAAAAASGGGISSEWSGGRDWKDDFPEWEPVHQQAVQATAFSASRMSAATSTR